ncbi:MAG: hypothetical protein ABI255_05535 [Microbacteriaceae bacterium]
MPRNSGHRPGRAIGILLVTVIILAIGAYGPLTLLGPLPRAQATIAAPSPSAQKTTGPALPADGASAVALSQAKAPIASAGSTEPVPMAGITKIITALVVLKAKPMGPGRTGPAITITAEDYQSYIDYGTKDARAVIVFPGETWTEREMLQALVLGSSNNHADSLARWAYGSLSAFLTAANDWLASHGMSNTHVADATGLDDGSVGTAADLAKLAGLAMADPTLAELISHPSTTLANQRGVENTTPYLPEDGITGISRSYTDAAGVCFLFAATISVGQKPFTFYGAFIRQPDYDQLTADLVALIDGARSDVRSTALVTRGTGYAIFRAPWGATSRGVAARTVEAVGWQLQPPSTTVQLTPVRSGRAGEAVGTISFPGTSGLSAVPILLDSPLTDPGPGWRLLNPIPVIEAFFNRN